MFTEVARIDLVVISSESTNTAVVADMSNGRLTLPNTSLQFKQVIPKSLTREVADISEECLQCVRAFGDEHCCSVLTEYDATEPR